MSDRGDWGRVMPTIGALLERNAYLYPNREAFIFGDQRPTHAAFLGRSKRLAAALYDRGLRAQDRISVVSNNRLEYFEAFAAAEIAGYILHTVNHKMSLSEISFVIGDAVPKAVVFEAEFAPLIEGLRRNYPDIRHFICLGQQPEWAEDYEAVVAGGAPEGPPIRARPADMVYLMYTSGTTGRPKGCMLTHQGVYRMAEAITRECGVGSDERMLLTTPMFYIGVKSFQLAQVLRGATAILHRAFEAGAVVNAIERDRATFTFMVPTMLQAVLDLPDLNDRDLGSLRTIVVSGAPIPVPLLRRGLSAFGDVFVTQYGLTEGGGTALHKHQIRPDGKDQEVRRLASCGQAHAGTEIRIVNDAGDVCASCDVGEVQLRSPTLFAGYWNNSVATIDAMRDGWYRTGDLGYLDEEGYLFLVDRKKDMIISGGENIYSKEVEDALIQHPEIAEVSVIGVPDEYWGESVMAVAVLRPGSALTAETLIAFGQSRLANYKCPKAVMFVTELPRVASGKVSKVALRNQYRDKRQQR